MRIKRLLSLIIAIIITTACLSGCGSFNNENAGGNSSNTANSGNTSNTGNTNTAPGQLERYTDVYYDVFDTVVSLIAYCESQEAFDALTKEIHDGLRDYHKLYDIYLSYEGLNNAKTINKNAGGEPVEVDERIIDLLEISKELCKKTDGKVNVAMGSVLKLWHEAREYSTANPEKAYIPSLDDLKAAMQHCNIDDVVVDRNASTVQLKDPEMSLDLGAVAKGYATEMVAQKLEKEGYGYVLLSVGGNVRAIGGRADGSDWVVGIQNPDLNSDKSYVEKVPVRDVSIVTSGVYQRNYECDGKSYHHIIDPSTLMPETRFLSVSIRCKDSALADAYSTAVFNMDLEEGKKLIEGLDGVEAFWILPDESFEKSSGWVTSD